MNDLGLDSLDTVEVIMAMEDEFGRFTYSMTFLLQKFDVFIVSNKLCGVVSGILHSNWLRTTFWARKIWMVQHLPYLLIVSWGASLLKFISNFWGQTCWQLKIVKCIFDILNISNELPYCVMNYFAEKHMDYFWCEIVKFWLFYYLFADL